MTARLGIAAALFVIVAIGLQSTAEDRLEAMAVRRSLASFLTARMGRDETTARSFLTAGLREALEDGGGFSLIGSPNPHYHAYDIARLDKVDDDTWIALVRIDEEFSGGGLYGWFEETITVKKVGESYRVAGIRRGHYQANR